MREVAVRAAKSAGKIHNYYFRKGFTISTKSGIHDRVTDADIDAEKKIVSLIKKKYPDHNFLCEEDSYEKTTSPYTWIIDPLDGTNNFSHYLPIFCVSIALAYKGEIILGVIYDVTRDELFYAEKGKGAFLNGKKISVTKEQGLLGSLLVTGFYYDRSKRILVTLQNIERFFKQNILGIRRLGSAALDLCYVACGRMDGFWEFYLNPWDFAAGSLIVEEAGGLPINKERNCLLPVPMLLLPMEIFILLC